MKKFTILALILTLASNFAYALSSDRNQPIRIQADHFLGDEIKQTATYTGNVRVDQGTMRLTGKRLELVETAKGYHVGTLTGNLATFRQKRDPRIRGVEEWISGHAQKIVYEEQTGVITLTGDALVERSENGVIKDFLSSCQISFPLSSRTRGFARTSRGVTPPSHSTRSDDGPSFSKSWVLEVSRWKRGIV